MAKFTGRLVDIGIGKEATRGVGVDAQYWIPKTAITFDDKISKALVAGSYGNITDAPMTATIVSRWAEGNLEGELNLNSFGLLLLALVGSESYSLAESGVGQHDYSLDNSVQHPSLTIHVKDPIGAMRFRMAMINSLEITIALGDYVRYSANFISKAHQDEASPTVSYASDHRFTSKDLTVKVADDISGLSGASKLSIRSLTLTFEKEVERLEVLGTLDPEDIVNKTIRITGTLELNYEDRTWRDYMLNGNIKAMQIKLEGSKLIGATKYPTLDIQFPKVHFEEWEPSRELGDIATQSINFTVMFDFTNERLWSTLQILNTVTSAY